MSAALRTCVGSAHQNAAAHAEGHRSAPVAAVPQPTVRLAGRHLEWQQVSRRRRRRTVTVAAAVRLPPSLRLTLFRGQRRIFGNTRKTRAPCPPDNAQTDWRLLRTGLCPPPLLNAVVAVLQGSRTTTQQAPSKTDSASYKANNDELKVSGLLVAVALHAVTGTLSLLLSEQLADSHSDPDHFVCFSAFFVA